MSQRRPWDLMIIAALMILFGLAEVVTSFTHAFFGITTTRGIVSMAGQGTGAQRVLVRADLLVGVQQLIDTEFQMEYLPSGAACRGRVQRIDPGGLGFRARCRMADGRRRSIHARWDSADGGVLSGGVIVSRALA